MNYAVRCEMMFHYTSNLFRLERTFLISCRSYVTRFWIALPLLWEKLLRDIVGKHGMVWRYGWETRKGRYDLEIARGNS